MPLCVTVGVAAALLVVCAHGAATAAAPRPGANVTVVPLMRPGDTGYAAYRIPGMAAYVPSTPHNDSSPRSVVIAVAEGRKFGCDDLEGQHDLMLLRSVDGGATWLGIGAPRCIVDAATGVDPITGSNQSAIWDPTPVYDEQTGILRVFFAWCATPHDRLAGRNHVMFVASRDDGATWTAPHNVTAATTKGNGFPGPTTGNGHGIQMRGGRFDGRLVVPLYGHVLPSGDGAAVLTSDDGGATWIRRDGCCPHTAEPEVAQLWSAPDDLYFCLRAVGSAPMACGGGALARPRTAAKPRAVATGAATGRISTTWVRCQTRTTRAPCTASQPPSGASSSRTASPTRAASISR